MSTFFHQVWYWQDVLWNMNAKHLCWLLLKKMKTDLAEIMPEEIFHFCNVKLILIVLRIFQVNGSVPGTRRFSCLAIWLAVVYFFIGMHISEEICSQHHYLINSATF